MKRRDFLGLSMAAAAGAVFADTASATDQAADTSAPQTPSPDSPAPKRKIKIAQIGVRHEHAYKIASLKMLSDDFEILGVAAESPADQKAHEKDANYKGLRWMSQDELLDLPGLEAVAVETEMTELLPTAKRCAERGLAIHVDKPLGQNLDECRELFEICRKNHVLMQPGYMFRTNPAIRLAIRAVCSGWLGEVFDLRANMDRNDTDKAFRKWLATYRGGGMYDFGSHLVDFVVEMFGTPNEVTVFERPDPADGLNDNTLSVLLYDRAIVQLRVNERSPVGNAERSLEITGTCGRFRLMPLENWSRDAAGKLPPLVVNLTLTQDTSAYKAGTHKIELAQFEDRYIGQLIEFAQILRGEKENPYTLEHELDVQRTILAASGYPQ